MTKREYYIMDGRARWDMDRAAVLYAAHGLKDAKANLRHFGEDSVIVSYGPGDNKTTDGRIEWMREMEDAA